MRFFWGLILVCLLLSFNFQDGNKTYTDRRREKINNQFQEVFFKTKDYYLLNNILNIEEKQKILFKLNNNTPEEKEKIFENLILEKSEEIKNIGNYQKEEWKKSYETTKKIMDFPQTRTFRIIVAISLVLFGLFYLFIFPFRRKL